MLYISGIYALNLPCALDTCGDWHQSALRWDNVLNRLSESDGSFFGDYGIEPNHQIPEHTGYFNVANTIRACLDLIHDGQFGLAGGMNEDFISNPIYDNEVFEKILAMKQLPHWPEIDRFMGKEYKMKWVNFVQQIM